MQKVIIKLANTTIQTHGPRWDPPEWLNGKLIYEGVSDTVYIPPGEPYECTVDEAVGLLRVKECQVVSEPAPQACLDAIAAYDREQAAKYPAYVPKAEDLAGGARSAGRVTVTGERDGGRPW
jgi:hypothetical protein